MPTSLLPEYWSVEQKKILLKKKNDTLLAPGPMARMGLPF
jgi:hypothetical protein